MEKLFAAKTDLEECVKILSFEPMESTEATFCEAAKRVGDQLAVFIKRLQTCEVNVK